MAKQKFREDTTGTLEFYNPEMMVPTSGNVTIYYPGGSELQAQTAATVDTVSTSPVTGYAPSKGDSWFRADVVTGMAVGTKYILEYEQAVTVPSHKAIIECKSIKTAIMFDADVGIVGTFPFDCTDDSNTVISGYKLTYSLTTTHTAAKDKNYRAAWDYVIGGVTYYADTLFDVVTEKDYYPTTLQDVIQVHSWIEDHLEEHDLDGRDIMEMAWSRRLVPMMDSKRLDITRVRDKQQLVPLHIAIIRQLLLENMADLDPQLNENADRSRSDTQELLEGISSALTWYDENENLGAGGAEELANKSGSRITR